MEDESVAQHVPLGLREEGHQIALDFFRRGLGGPTEALRNALNVRVDDDALGSAECDAEHDVGRLASDARQLDQLGLCARHLTAVLFDEQLGQADDVLRLLAVHADAIDAGLDVFLGRASERFSRGKATK